MALPPAHRWNARSWWWRLLLVAGGVAALALFAAGYGGAVADPVVRHASIAMPEWPQDAPAVTVVLASDTHVVGPDMPPSRLRRIVAAINAQRPDIVVLAGDFVSDRLFATRHYDSWDSIAPLAGLTARYGSVAVLGNHDHERGIAGIRRALRKAHILLLKDDAQRIGPLVVGGTDDPVTQHEDLELTLARMRALGPGPRVLLSHGPALFPFLPPDVPLLLVGHTHCGQVRILEALRAPIRCGVERHGGRTLVVSGGLGASVLPIRFGAPPEIWVLHLGPPATGGPVTRPDAGSAPSR